MIIDGNKMLDKTSSVISGRVKTFVNSWDVPRGAVFGIRFPYKILYQYYIDDPTDSKDAGIPGKLISEVFPLSNSTPGQDVRMEEFTPA